VIQSNGKVCRDARHQKLLLLRSYRAASRDNKTIMGDLMMDQNTIDKLQLERDRVEVVRKYEREQTLKSFYEQIREERVKQSKLKKTIRIMVISFVLLMTVMVVNVNTLAKWESKAIGWFHKYPNIFENPFNLK
jgi:hypothetical protein